MKRVMILDACGQLDMKHSSVETKLPTLSRQPGLLATWLVGCVDAIRADLLHIMEAHFIRSRSWEQTYSIPYAILWFAIE